MIGYLTLLAITIPYTLYFGKKALIVSAWLLAAAYMMESIAFIKVQHVQINQALEQVRGIQ